MDPLQNKTEDRERISDNSTEPPITVVHSTGHVQLQLAGSHTTDTETESPALNGKEKKNVKFEDNIKGNGDEKQDYNQDRNIEDKKTVLEDQLPSSSTSKIILKKPLSSDRLNLFKPLHDLSFQQIGQENFEIAQRFKQIMEMFENFSRNLESLDLETKSNADVKSTNRRKISKTFYHDEQNKRQRKYMAEKSLKAAVSDNNLRKTASIETTQSGIARNLLCKHLNKFAFEFLFSFSLRTLINSNQCQLWQLYEKPTAFSEFCMSDINQRSVQFKRFKPIGGLLINKSLRTTQLFK